MPKINFQFHATKEETAKYIVEKINEYNLAGTLISWFPTFCYTSYKAGNLSYSEILNSDEVLLTLKLPIVGYTSRMDLLIQNTEFLSVIWGEQEQKKLYESRISGVATNDTLKIWKQIVAKYKKKMQKGAWITAENKSSKQYYPNHRYTSAAKSLYEQGYKICPFGGTCTYELTNIQQ